MDPEDTSTGIPPGEEPSKILPSCTTPPRLIPPTIDDTNDNLDDCNAKEKNHIIVSTTSSFSTPTSMNVADRSTSRESNRRSSGIWGEMAMTLDPDNSNNMDHNNTTNSNSITNMSEDTATALANGTGSSSSSSNTTLNGCCDAKHQVPFLLNRIRELEEAYHGTLFASVFHDSPNDSKKRKLEETSISSATTVVDSTTPPENADQIASFISSLKSQIRLLSGECQFQQHQEHDQCNDTTVSTNLDRLPEIMSYTDILLALESIQSELSTASTKFATVVQDKTMMAQALANLETRMTREDGEHVGFLNELEKSIRLQKEKLEAFAVDRQSVVLDSCPELGSEQTVDTIIADLLKAHRRVQSNFRKMAQMATVATSEDVEMTDSTPLPAEAKPFVTKLESEINSITLLLQIIDHLRLLSTQDPAAFTLLSKSQHGELSLSDEQCLDQLRQIAQNDATLASLLDQFNTLPSSGRLATGLETQMANSIRQVEQLLSRSFVPNTASETELKPVNQMTLAELVNEVEQSRLQCRNLQAHVSELVSGNQQLSLSLESMALEKDQLASELDATKSVKQTLQSQMETVVASQHQYEELVASYKSSVEVLESEKSELAQQVQVMRESQQSQSEQDVSYLSTLSASLGALVTKIRPDEVMMQDDTSEQQALFDTCAQRISVLEVELDTRGNTITSLQQTLTEKSSEYDTLLHEKQQSDIEYTNTLASVEEQVIVKVTELQTELETYKSTKEALESELQSLKESTLAQQSSMTNDMVAKLTDLESQVSAVTVALAEKSRHYVSLMNTYEDTKASLESLSQSHTETMTQLESLQVAKTELESQHVAKLSELETLNTRIVELQTSLETERGAFETELSALTQSTESLKTELEQLKQERLNESTKSETLCTRTAELESQVTDLQSQLLTTEAAGIQLRLEMDTQSQELDEMKNQFVMTKESLESEKSKSGELESRITSLLEQVSETENAMDALRTYFQNEAREHELKMTVLTDEKRGLEDLMKDMSSKHEALLVKTQELESQLVDIKAEASNTESSLKQELETTISMLGERTDELNRLSELQTELQTQLSTLESEKTALEQERNTLRSEMQSVEGDLHSAVSNWEHRALEAEKAVETQHALITDLKEQVNRVKVEYEEILDSVKRSEEDKLSLETQLREAVGLVETKSAALELLTEQIKTLQTTHEEVTEEWRGKVNLLTSQLTDAQDEVKTVTEALKTKEEQLAELSTQVSTLSQSVQQLESQVHELSETKSSLEVSLTKAQEDAEFTASRLNDSLEVKSQQIMSLMSENTDLDTQLKSAKQELESLKTQLQENESSLAGLQDLVKEVDEMQANLSEAQSRVEEYRSAKLGLEEQVGDLTRETREMRDTLDAEVRKREETTVHYESLLAEKEGLWKQKMEETETYLQHSKTVSETLREKVQSLENMMMVKTDQCESLSKEKDMLREEIGGLKVRLSGLESQRHAMESELSELRESVAKKAGLESKIKVVENERSKLIETVTFFETESTRLKAQNTELTKKNQDFIARLLETEEERDDWRNKYNQDLTALQTMVDKEATTRASKRKSAAANVDETENDSALPNTRSTPVRKDSMSGRGSSTKKRRVASQQPPSSGVATPTAPGRFVLSFSGFRDSMPNYNNKTKAQLIKAAEKLGASMFNDSDNFDPKITHVIAPANSKTLKTFAASLSGRWIIHDYKWILDSAEKGAWLPEDKYGFVSKVNPFASKKFYLAPSFQEECQRSDIKFRLKFIKTLAVEFGNGIVVDNEAEADFVIRGSGDKGLYSCDAVDWHGFVALVPMK